MIAALLTVLGACLLVERLRPGWKQPNRSEWECRVLFLAAFELCMVLMIGTLVKNWWHRMRHECGFLWRIFHQLHHSPGRLGEMLQFRDGHHKLRSGITSKASHE